ncbi:MAG: hypothetical protein ABFD91_09995 [Anaerohalosphaeraceae bacterium]
MKKQVVNLTSSEGKVLSDAIAARGKSTNSMKTGIYQRSTTNAAHT